MSIKLTLSSNTVVNQDSQDFVIKFISPINLNDGQYEMALTNLNLWYSWYNISAEKGNNILRYYNGTIWRPDIVIPDGQYTLSQLNSFLHETMKDNGDFTISGSGQEVYDIIIEANLSTIRTKVTVTNGYQLDVSQSLIYLLFGCDPVIITVSGDCPYVANINDSINNLVVHSDAVDGRSSYSNSNKSDILLTFVPTTSPGTNINKEPQNLVYLPLSLDDGQLSEIRMYITDDLDRIINLNGEPVTYSIHIRKIQEESMKSIFDSFFDKLENIISLK